MKDFIRIFITWLIIFSIVIGGGSYFIVEKLALSKEENVLEDEKTGDIEFVVMGVDTKDTKAQEGQRTDTIMVCKYFKETGKISILSLPRDCRVDITGHGKDKLNHAYAYGGPKLTLSTINKLLDMNIEYYITVDYNLVKEVVDKLGGIEVNVPMDMYYSDPVADPPLLINLKKGVQVLDGEKSMQFLRFRKGYEDQDLGRVVAQQEFVKSTIDTILKPKNLIKIPSIINSGFSNVDTNISLSLMLNYVSDLTNIATEKVVTRTLEGEPDMVDGVSYFLVDQEVTNKIVYDLFYNENIAETVDISEKNIDEETE